jgi:hypothetical protein
MVLGKLLILLNGSIAHSSTFSYNSGLFYNNLNEPSFGWFKKLNPEQLAEHYQSVFHSLQYAENGHTVSWYRQDASGKATAVFTWPTGNGFCRKLHIETIAFNKKVVQTPTACYRNSFEMWEWVRE